MATDLPALALSRPKAALAKARETLATHPPADQAAVAHQTIGIVLRDFGDIDQALRELSRAARLARTPDVLATLGATEVQAGQTHRGLATFDEAIARSSGSATARIRHRRAVALWRLGRHDEALDDLRLALPVLRRADDILWTARALTLRALIHLARGSTVRADSDNRTAERLFTEAGQELESVFAVHNRGLVAFREGDLPAALTLLHTAEQRYRALGTPMAELHLDRCAVLLAAGLAGDALAEADRGIRQLEHSRGQATWKAELLLVAGRAALAAGDPPTAMVRTRAAAKLFAVQHREWWRIHARFVLLQSRFATGAPDGRLLGTTVRTAEQLSALRSPEASQAYLLAGRIALALGRSADHHLAQAARSRHHGPPLARVTGWLASALQASAPQASVPQASAPQASVPQASAPQASAPQASAPQASVPQASVPQASVPQASAPQASAPQASAPQASAPQAENLRRIRVACSRGLDLLDEYRFTLGAAELRAQATAYGGEFLAIAQRTGLTARQLLVWSERSRATTSVVRPPPDAELHEKLAAFREISSRVERGDPLQAQRHRLETQIREHAMRAPGNGGGHRLDPGELLEELRDDRLVSLVETDGELRLLICGAGRIRAVPAGRITAEVDYARSALRRAVYQGGRLEVTGRRLQEALFGDALRQLGDEPIVIVPPARLHTVPWALMPAFRDRPFHVVPSAAAWLRARRTAPPDDARVVLVRGPGLGGAEIEPLAASYDKAAVLPSETVTGVLEAIDGCGLAHIAAHGSFRADNPLFSSLRLADGLLTGYDLERLNRAPHRVVLSSCDSGQLSPVGADALLGFTVALLALGTTGIVASPVPVHDRATAALMLDLHAALRSGATMASALCAARASGDPSALAFVALGAT